jgi:hypothetical protein
MKKIKINKVVRLDILTNDFYPIKDNGECIFIDYQFDIKIKEKLKQFDKNIHYNENELYIGNLKDKYDEKIFNLIKRIKTKPNNYYFDFIFEKKPTKNQVQILVKKINEFNKIII